MTLLQAEALFKDAEVCRGEGALRGGARTPTSRSRLKNKSLYKLGWCQAQTGQFAEAVKTYTDYIEKNQGQPTLASALHAARPGQPAESRITRRQ